ncbi:MAG TPA: hypothetical protein VKY15_00650 [Acidimicrobiales bacterium]|nr:hypothetical protein [Acidimicrobiales bacterium]
MGPAYDLVLAAHVLSALVGMGAVATTGFYAARLAAGHLGPAELRYFRPGRNWPARALWAVPALGAGLVGLSGGEFSWTQPWVDAGVGLAATLVAVCQAVVWPAEARLQRHLAQAPGARAGVPPGEPAGGRWAPGGPAGRGAELAGLGRRLLLGAVAAELVATAAFVVMFAKPGGPS